MKKEVLLSCSTEISTDTAEIPDFFRGEVHENELPKFIWKVQGCAPGVTTGPDEE